MSDDPYLEAEVSPITLGFSSTQIVDGSADLAEMFRRTRALALIGVFEAKFLTSLSQIADRAHYAPRNDLDRGGRLWEEPGTASKAVTLALQRRGFLEWLERMTGYRPLTSVYGDILESPYNSHRFGWHDDLPSDEDPLRRLGVTIDFSPTCFEGGDFRMRTKLEKRSLLRHQHRARGSVLIFDVSHCLEHRVGPVTGGGPRRVYTGWFQTMAV